jgi:hypothetical protein
MVHVFEPELILVVHFQLRNLMAENNRCMDAGVYAANGTDK